MICVDAAWSAVEPLDMRAGVDNALARVVNVFGEARLDRLANRTMVSSTASPMPLLEVSGPDCKISPRIDSTFRNCCSSERREHRPTKVRIKVAAVSCRD